MCVQCVVGRKVVRERDHMEDQGADGRVILKRIFKKWNTAWRGMMWLRIGTIGMLSS